MGVNYFLPELSRMHLRVPPAESSQWPCALFLKDSSEPRLQSTYSVLHSTSTFCVAPTSPFVIGGYKPEDEFQNRVPTAFVLLATST